MAKVQQETRSKAEKERFPDIEGRREIIEGRNEMAVQGGPPVLQDRPAWLQQGAGARGRGSENVRTEDLVVPRLEIVQGLSPALDSSKDGYIEGSKIGDIYNSVSRVAYPQPVYFVPVLYRMDYNVWRDRKSGGGFRGSFPTRDLAVERLEQIPEPERGVHQILDTPQQFGIVVRPDGKFDPIVISMTRTKAKISRRFNSLIHQFGAEDRWARVYTFRATREKNDLGEFMNFSFAAAGFASQEVFKAGEDFYNEIKARGVQASTDYEHDETPDAEGTTEY